MNQIIRIGMDTSKYIFQLHGVDASEQVVLRKRLGRNAMLAFFAKLSPTVVVIEACGAAHHLARELGRLGHTAKLMAPQLVKPYVPRNKNDGRDAEGAVRGGEPAADAICAGEDGGAAGGTDVVGRPRPVGRALHAAEQYDPRSCGGVRPGRIQGLDKLASFLAAIEQDERVPVLARELFAVLAREYARVQAELKAIEAKLLAWHRADAVSRRLVQIPGVGPVTAGALVMKAPDPHAFRSGRLFAAWLGLTPKDHSTGGKTRLGKITRAGDERLRQLLVVGATSVVKQAKAKGHGPRWLIELLKRKTPKLAAVALANKMARIAWKLMTTGECYQRARLDARTDGQAAAAA